jgi:hypothetical protein
VFVKSANANAQCSCGENFGLKTICLLLLPQRRGAARRSCAVRQQFVPVSVRGSAAGYWRTHGVSKRYLDWTIERRHHMGANGFGQELTGGCSHVRRHSLSVAGTVIIVSSYGALETSLKHKNFKGKVRTSISCNCSLCHNCNS